jgi:hypothetical protein
VHPYASVNIKREDVKSILYDTIELPWGELEQYTLSHKIGRGRYAHVFEGTDTKRKQKVALKVLLPIKPSKIKREYHFLKTLNHPNIIKLVDVVKCSHLKTASLVTELFPHQDFRELYPTLSLKDIKFYTKQLFEVPILPFRLSTIFTPRASCTETSSRSTSSSTPRQDSSRSSISDSAITTIPLTKTTPKWHRPTTRPPNSTSPTLNTTTGSTSGLRA